MISLRIEEVENSHLNRKEKKKRINELDHFSNFVNALKRRGVINDVNKIELLELTIEPDFIISFRNQKIGLEVRRIKNERAEEIGIKRSLLSSAERIFKDKYPDVKAFANVSFKDSVEITKNDNLATKLADYIYSEIFFQGAEMPYFVKRARCVEHSCLTFDLSGTYWVGDLENEIKMGIQEKEKKLSNYRAKSGLEKIWLLVVISGDSPDSDFSAFDERKFNYRGGFDSVLMLNEFKNDLYFLSDNWR